MKNRILSLLLFYSSLAWAQQNPITNYAGKIFTLNFYTIVTPCDLDGIVLGGAYPVDAPKNALFEVDKVTASEDLVIRFRVWKLKEKWKTKDSLLYQEQFKKRQIFNFKEDALSGKKEINSLTGNDDNLSHFLLKKKDFDLYCTQYIKDTGTVSYGALVEPFKLRNHPSYFTTNLSLGAVVGYQRNFPGSKEYFWGVFGGLSISSITLDSLSTGGKVTTNSERPAITPSLNILLGHKNINLTFGIGWDIINRTSALEKSWIYNGSWWLGFGIGISLFNSSSQKATGSTQKQK